MKNPKTKQNIAKVKDSHMRTAEWLIDNATVPAVVNTLAVVYMGQEVFNKTEAFCKNAALASVGILDWAISPVVNCFRRNQKKAAAQVNPVTA